MNNEMARIIEVANDLVITGSTAGSTGECIAAAFVLNDMALLEPPYEDTVNAWERLGDRWQQYVKEIKRHHMDRIQRPKADI